MDATTPCKVAGCQRGCVHPRTSSYTPSRAMTCDVCFGSFHAADRFLGSAAILCPPCGKVAAGWDATCPRCLEPQLGAHQARAGASCVYCEQDAAAVQAHLALGAVSGTRTVMARLEARRDTVRSDRMTQTKVSAVLADLLLHGQAKLTIMGGDVRVAATRGPKTAYKAKTGAMLPASGNRDAGIPAHLLPRSVA